MSTHAIGRETGSGRVLSDPGCNFLSNFYQRAMSGETLIITN
jgi:hypothetical protein